MDVSVTNYKLNEARFNARIAEFRQSDTLTTLRDELALAKSLIEDRLNAAATPAERAACLPMVRDLLNTVGALVKAHRAYELQAGELLTKDALREFAKETVTIITDELRGMADWELIVDKICDRLSNSVENANNETADTSIMGD
ncbi:MAG TPA: hypothetical protein VFE46_16575 [Pirellulales bacterium]|jgi:hypothetical protein|nr:hypothetical protein [Pirellulales bacterium]